MKKRIIGLLVIVLLISVLSGCKESEAAFPDGITTAEFSNDILSLRYPDSYSWQNVAGDAYVFNHSLTFNIFQMRPTLKQMNSLEDETKYFIDLAAEIAQQKGIEQKAVRTEDIKADGKNAKLVTLEDGIGDSYFLLIDYSADSYYLIDFFMEFDEDNIQIVKAIAASIKFK